MDIRRLNHLVALADERNFGRAAQQVHLSQPAFSRSVQAAERELGLQLFDRGGTEVRCTAAGSFVVERARRLLFDSRCLERDAGLFRERVLGDISFGVGPYPAATLLPQLLIELRTRYGGINSRVEVNNWKYLLEHLRAEELDFFVADVRDVPPDGDLAIQAAGRLTAHFYVRAGHPLLAQRKPKPSATVPYGLASVRVPEDIKRLLRHLLEVPDDQPLPVAVECDDTHLLKQVCLASNTVLAIADAAVATEVASGAMSALELVGSPPLFSDMGIVSLRGRSHSPMAQHAIDFLAQLAARSNT